MHAYIMCALVNLSDLQLDSMHLYSREKPTYMIFVLKACLITNFNNSILYLQLRTEAHNALLRVLHQITKFCAQLIGAFYV